MDQSLKPADATTCARFRSSSPNIARWPKSARSGRRKLPRSAQGRRNADEVRSAARRLRRDINPTLNARWMNEMFTRMGNAFEEQRFMPDGNVIEEHQMLVNLTHVPDVRRHRQPKFARQQTHRNKFGDPRQPRAIRLHEMQRTSLHEILEQDSIRHVLAQRDARRRNRLRQSPMSFNIVRV